jgi:hypothetical protein
VSHPSCVLPPGKGPPVPIGQEAGWASEPVWTQRPEGKSFASAGDQAPVIQSVVRPQILLNYESRKILLIILVVQFTNVLEVTDINAWNQVNVDCFVSSRENGFHVPLLSKL